MNLLKETWIPVRRKSGKEEWIKPSQITDKSDSDPVMTIDAARPDFNGALLQFLIGFLQTALTPKDEDEWEELFNQSPSVTELDNKFEPFIKAFDLDGDGPRFFQDLTLETGSDIPISRMLIDMPGKNALEHNTDHFVKRNTIQNLCHACTATTLLTLQVNAPSGGQGHRTSLRGGGPLTTVIISHSSKFKTLWHNLWLNVLLQHELDATNCNSKLKKLETIFPWLAETKTSENDVQVLGNEINPLQAYWAMPRRIRLSTPRIKDSNCDICSKKSDLLYAHYSTKNYGILYAENILHPLSPYYNDKNILRPSHPQPGGFTYRHWPSIATVNERALVIRSIDNKVRFMQTKINYAIHAFGYDMDNMKARCWYEAVIPYWSIDSEIKNLFNSYISSITSVATLIASNTRKAVQTAFFNPNNSKGNFDFVQNEFWQRTEMKFFETVANLVESLKIQSETTPILVNWLKILQANSIEIYDFYSRQVSIVTGSINGVPRTIAAGSDLRKFNSSKKILEELGLSKEGITA